MTWLEMSARWHRSRLRGYRFVRPTLSAIIMFIGALLIHVAFNLVQWLAASL